MPRRMQVSRVEAADPMVPVEGALVNSNVVALDAEPANSQDGAGAPTSQRLITKVGRGKGKAKESSASTPGTSATTSGARTGVSTPASDASIGTKRKHTEIDGGDPDVIDNYQRMIKELLGVMVRIFFFLRSSRTDGSYRMWTMLVTRSAGPDMSRLHRDCSSQRLAYLKSALVFVQSFSEQTLSDKEKTGGVGQDSREAEREAQDEV